MGSMMKYALPAVGVALPFMFPAAAGAAGAGAAAGGAGLAGTGLAGGAALPLTGLGPGGIGMASFGGAPFAGSGGLFTSMGVGPNTVMPHAGIPRFMGALKNSFGSSMNDPKNYLRYAQTLSGDEDQQQPLPPPPMAPPIQPLVDDENSFAGAMRRPPRPELGPSYLPPVDPWSIPDVTTAVPGNGYMGQGTPLPDPLAGYTPTPMDLTGYLRWLQQQQPQY